MKAISIKQPWASLICTPRAINTEKGIKDIENRTWRTHFRGRVCIHASQKMVNDIYINALSDEQWWFMGEGMRGRMDLKDFHLSAIIGEVDIVDCVINHPSIWAEQTASMPNDIYDISNGLPSYLGKGNKGVVYNWVLANPVIYDEPILNVKGKLSFWEFEK